MIEIVTKSAGQTVELGRKIGQQLKGGEIFCLVGELGAGKTHFVKGIAAGVGAKSMEKVTSPTFVLVNEYVGRLEVFHIDAYRIERPADFEMLGFDEFCHPGAVVIIEWADKVESVLKKMKCIHVKFRHAGENSRIIEIEGLAQDFRIDY